MTFLNSSILWFLPVILLPIIIHLLSKRKARRVEFSSLRFLKVLEQNALKTFNIKQLILLILRTLIILLIILAFARPTIQQGAGFQLATRPQTLTVIAVDNTASMRSVFQKPESNQHLETLATLRDHQTDVWFLGLGDSVFARNAADIQPTWSAPVIQNIAGFVRRHLPVEDYARREIIVLSDGQLPYTLTDSLAPDWWRGVLHIPVESDRGITGLTLPERVFQPGDTYEIHAQIASNGEPFSDDPVELWINGNRINQVLLNTAGAVNTGLEMKGLVEGRQAQEGQLNLTTDANSYNDARYFVLQPGEKVRVGVLAPVRQPNIWQILSSALAQQAYHIELEMADVHHLDGLVLTGMNTLIWETSVKLSGHHLARMGRFVENGGQLIVIGAIDANLADALELPRTIETESNEYGFPVRMTPRGEQIFAGVPLKSSLENRRLIVKKRYLTDYDFRAGEDWLLYADDTPLVSMMPKGGGRLVWLNTSFAPDGTNWPILGVFPAMLVRMFHDALPELDVDGYNRVVRQNLLFPQDAQVGGDPLQVQLPNGQSQFIQADSLGRLIFPAAREPGFYRLFQGARQLASIAVNVEPEEAVPVAEIFINDFTDRFDVVLDEEQDMVEQVLAHRQGVPLWPWFLLFALLLFLIETFLARIPRGWRQQT
ncbi:MAG: BatA domain-containing protein [Lentisphaeria bacterium]|nr:BatA domain-containing protein [Candidatus Neomarinimicrobiota bacterium]MCF7842845.1 BatA domain-containing protein [Lentisphaeria bacterium]